MSAALVVEDSAQTTESTAVSVIDDLLPLTAERKLAFLQVLENTGGNLTKAAKLIGTTKQNVYRWRETDPAFEKLYLEALEAGTENLEENVYNRACTNSDTLAIFLLKARRPEKYRDNYTVDVTGLDSAQLTQGFIELLRELVAAQRESVQQQLGPATIDVTATTRSSEDTRNSE